MKDEFSIGKLIIHVITLFIISVVCVTLGVVVISNIRVYTSRMAGQATFAHSEAERKVLVSQAEAELEASKLRAEAIKIVGEMAQKYPEYREQEFIGAFGEALRSDKIDQIIYVPTEANIPIIERKR
jgi:hypothetical protein